LILHYSNPISYILDSTSNQPGSAISTTEAEKGIPPYSTIQKRKTAHSASPPHDPKKPVCHTRPQKHTVAASRCCLKTTPRHTINTVPFPAASPATILIATTSHRPEQTDRAVPTQPMSLHVLRYTKTAPYLAPRTSLLPTTLRHHQASPVARQQTWLPRLGK
jgi:hypothetical protein